MTEISNSNLQTGIGKSGRRAGLIGKEVKIHWEAHWTQGSLKRMLQDLNERGVAGRRCSKSLEWINEWDVTEELGKVVRVGYVSWEILPRGEVELLCKKMGGSLSTSIPQQCRMLCGTVHNTNFYVWSGACILCGTVTADGRTLWEQLLGQVELPRLGAVLWGRGICEMTSKGWRSHKTQERGWQVQLDKKWLIKETSGQKCVLGSQRMSTSPQPHLPWDLLL